MFILNIIWILWLLGDIPRFKNTRWMRLGLYLLLFSILIAEWLGYRNLSFILLRGLFGTVIVFGIFILADRLFSELYDELDQGRYSWHRRIKIALGLKTLEHIPGLVWLRVITAIVIWGAFVFIILRIWDLSDTALQQIQDYLVEGFTIGSLRVIPLRVLLAAVTFLFLFTISSWLRSRLERSWLSKAYMERGAREAIVTISGYTGMAIAILVALGVAGLEFSNFAIIAGALSVGIGFGLQNIVNNFVSGLILLFERPIKTGDWIVVGGTEGYVKRIRIRSTQIQTFDRADVIVPNSELISGQVTNWMLYDPRGRVVIPVGVAYGSDTEMVKNILLEVADKHPLVISNEPTMEAKVLFMAFGESSLDFELRCYIQNIDNRLQVKSDLNFAIDAAFRKHGIEIPFPQRDIHFKNMPASDNRSSPQNSLK